MNIVFFGSSDFAVFPLEALLESGEDISCVVTQPDRKQGRGLHLASTAVKTALRNHKIKIYQPDNINAPPAREFLKGLHPELFVVIAYGQLLSQELLNIPKVFSINLHASLLPKYRGASPINWTIIKGEKITGITVIKLVKEMDAGPIILQKELDILDDDTVVNLGDKLSHLAVSLLLDSLKLIKKNSYKLFSQDESKVSFAPKLKKQDGCIDWRMPAVDIHNLIRGCFDWPGAFTYYQGKLLKVYRAKSIRVSEYQSIRVPGEILEVSQGGITVATQEGNLLIEEVQIEGKRRMSAGKFILGHKVCIGDRFDKK